MHDEMPENETPSMDRREALKVLTAAAASAAMAEGLLPAVADAQRPVVPGPKPRTGAAAVPPKTGPRGTVTDPELLNAKANWPRVLSVSELATLSVLCDMIIQRTTRARARRRSARQRISTST